MINLLVADDHVVVRKGVRQIIEDAVDMRVTGEAGSVQEVLSLIREQVFDVLVLDIKLSDGSGLEALRDIKMIQPGLGVCILSMYPEHQYATRALRSGASGYLTKESAPDELVNAVRSIARGERYVNRSLAETLADEINRDFDKQPHMRLSNRELQVLCSIAEGKTTTEIADQLSISVKTVSTYRRRVLDKMDMESNAELIRYAIEHELVDM